MTTIYDKLNTVRKSRVQITYEVEDGGKTEKKELPFVVGVMGNFSGQPTIPLESLKHRRFIDIEGNNFNEVMAKISPELNFKVKNTLKDGDSELGINLKFSHMNDFLPDQIALQVEPLKNLLDTRAKLKELLGKADNSEKLELILEKALNDKAQLESLGKDLGGGKSSDNPGKE
jgi:type VI secretion system protein ImpB